VPEAATRPHQRTRTAVQIGDVHAPECDHQRPLVMAGGPPVGDQAPPYVIRVLPGDDARMGFVQL
jgi:hypothetical protein